MAYEETSAEKAARKAREEANAKKGAEALKKADYEVFGSRGDAARKGMEEGKKGEGVGATGADLLSVRGSI